MGNGKHSSSGNYDFDRDIYSSKSKKSKSKKRRKESRDIYSSSKRPNTRLDIFLKILFIIEFIVMLGCTVYVATMQLLPFKYIIALLVLIAVVCLLQIFLKSRKRRKKIFRVLSVMMTLLILVMNFFAVSYLGTFHKSLKDMTGGDVELAANAANVTKEPFFVYVSGSDSRDISEIKEKTLSDVNMVVAVDPINHKVLMVNTPRDYYVALYGDSSKMDKLTHAGTYGIDCSMQTLEALYGIEFNYYVKVSFKSVVDIVDALGGITVDSELSFSSAYSLSGTRYYFNEGANELSGDAALAFVRERKSFAAGDRQRGKNQQLVISAVIDKAISPSILNPTKFKEVLTSVTGNTKTNISNSEITALFRMQLNNMSGWDIQSISVDGTGDSRTTYTYPYSYAYVMLPDDETVTEAKTALAQFLQ